MFNIDANTDQLLEEIIKRKINISNREFLLNLLLTNEISNETFDLINDFDTMEKFMEYTFDRYTQLTNNTQLEDEKWTKHTNNSSKYTLTDFEVVFENSIKKVHKYDAATLEHFHKLLNYFIRHKNNENLNIFFKLISVPYSDSTYFVIFVLQKIEN